MDPSRVVEILQDGKSRGSGYLITPHHVLTAAHVIKPANASTTCMVHPLCGSQATLSAEQARPQAVPGKMAWISAKHDLALIKILGAPLSLLDGGTIPFGGVPHDGMARQVVGSGFPAASGTDQRTIIGTLSWVGSGRFDVDVISALPRDWTKWGGFSGAAIFADNLLVGVVRTVDENWNGGVLEATPAAWLLADKSFNAYFENAGLSAPRLIDAGAMDRIMPLDFESDVSIKGYLRFSPRNPCVPFLGRDTELAALDEFLMAERKRPFSWWLVTGGGGAGKTRLARELCLRARRQGWRAGFLPRRFKTDESALDAWVPRTPTLIVADYVMTRIAEVRTLAARLARRDGLPRLRLLLLEREAGRLLESQFLGSDQSDRGVIENARYKPDSLSLPELTDDQLWSLVQACPWRAEAAQVPITRNEFFQRLRQLDRERRPLVAMILADALASSGDRAGLGGLEKELRELLDRDRKDLWPERVGVGLWKTEADIAIAFATMVDGLGPAELEIVEAARGMPIDPDILPECAIAIGKPLELVPRLGRLEPDLIGEFFVLQTLSPDPNNPFAKPAHSWMPRTAWRAHGSEMFDFVTRAKQTFPQHDSIQQVDITVAGVRESWLLAAFGILSRANDLTEGFADAQKWLLPNAKSDVGALLAFADFTLAVNSQEPGVVDPSLLLSLIINSDEAALHEAQDDLAARFGNAIELPLREWVARALSDKGGRLGALGRNEDAIAAYDDLAARFGNATELPLREQVAKALFDKGRRLDALGRSEDEIAAYDRLAAHFGGATELPLREWVARALFNKGITLGTLGRSEESIAAYDDLAARFGDATELPLREPVARALFDKGVTLGALGRSEDAIAAYDHLAARFGDATELPLREPVAKALVNKGVRLGALGRSEDEIAAYDHLAARFGNATELPLRESVAKALFYKGVALGALGRSEDEIAAYDHLAARFGNATELPLREQVAKALVNKGVALGALGRSEDAIAAYDDLAARFGNATELPLREWVAKALFNKGFRLGALGRSADAIAVYDDLIARFGTATELPLREQVAKTLFIKGITLSALDRSADAIAVYDDLIARFGTAIERPLRELVSMAESKRASLHKS